MQTDASPKERGLAALRQKDPNTAAQLLAEAVRANAGDAEAWSALGIALCQLQRVAEGQQALARAVSLAPTRAPLHFNLARGLELNGKPVEALASYRKALQLDPAHTGAGEAVKRLGTGHAAATPPAAGSKPGSALADFVLSDEGATLTPATAASTAAAPANPFAPPSTPSVRYVPPPAPAGPLRPMTTTVQPPAPAPRRGTPWGLIIGILAAVLVVMGGLVAILFAVVTPAIQQARQAARNARDRAEARARFPSGRETMPSFTPPADLGRPTATAAPGSELDQRGGGGMVDDNLFGFSAAFPAGFTAPMPQQSNRSVGLGGTASTQTFRATSPSGAAYILCYAFSPEVYDQVQGQLFSLGESALRKSAGGALRGRSTRYQGYAARDVEFGAARGRAGRGRMVLARPRLFVIAFEARDRSLLNKPGVTAYLDSLQIRDNVYPPSVQSPLMAPGRSATPPMPTPQRMAPQFPEGRFGPGGPPGGSFGGPNMPRPPSGLPRSRFRMGPGGGPELTPPSIPSPPDIPMPPTPSFPPSGGPPSFGPPGAGGS